MYLYESSEYTIILIGELVQGITTEYISKAINQLVNLLGIKEEVSFDLLYSKCINDDLKGCAEDIACYLGLPIDITLSYVPSSKPPTIVGNGFSTNSLSKTNHSKRGVEGITAQVEIPQYLPLFGSSELEHYQIKIKISEDLINDPSAFIPVIAHELSHVVLHSLRFTEKDNEYYTDLTAMILGFSDIMKDARNLVTDIETKQIGNQLLTNIQRVRYGYLSNDLFDYAYTKINTIIKDHLEQKTLWLYRLREMYSGVKYYENELRLFNTYLKYLGDQRLQKMNSADAKVIVSFFDPSYIDDVSNKATSYHKKYVDLRNKYENFSHFTKENISLLNSYSNETIDFITDIERDRQVIQEANSVCKKYIGFVARFKIDRQLNR